jgi:hypothetical protein
MEERERAIRTRDMETRVLDMLIGMQFQHETGGGRVKCLAHDHFEGAA